MADDNSQGTQSGNGTMVGGDGSNSGSETAALPAWLVKAQKMAEYESQRAPETDEKVSNEAVEKKNDDKINNVKNIETDFNNGVNNDLSASLVSEKELTLKNNEEDVKDDVGSLVSREVPDWIKKASIQASASIKNDYSLPVESVPSRESGELNNARTDVSGGIKMEDNPAVNSVVDTNNDVYSGNANSVVAPSHFVESKNPELSDVDNYNISPHVQYGDYQNPGLVDDINNARIQQSSNVSVVDNVLAIQKAGASEVTEQNLTGESSNVGSGNNQVQVVDAAKGNQAVKSEKDKSPLSFIWNTLDKMANKISQSQTAGVPVKESKENGGNKVGAPEVKVGTKEDMNEKQQVIEAEKIFQQGISTIRDLIAPSSMEIKYDSLRVEGLYCQTFYVYAYPRYLDTNWLSPVVNFDVTMDVAQFIYPIESATIMRVLKKKVTQMQSSVRMNAEKGMVSDPALETALQDAEELRVQIQRGQEKFFQFALYFTIYADEEKKLAKIAKQIESMLGGKLVLTKKCDLQMEHGFNSTLPLCIDELEVFRNMNTSPLSSTFPFSSADLTSNDGILYGLNRHNDSLVIFDRFSLENANSVVFAKSGAGKSYAVKLEILRSMMVGTDVIVIDPENEYEALAQTVGGAYLKVSLTSDRRINPFDLPAPLDGDEVQPGDLLKASIINLHGLLKIMLGGVTPEEEGILDKALNDVYALKGITADLVNPSEYPPPTMEDLYDILASMEGGLGLSQRLQKYTTGTYSGIFNKPTNVDLESGLMVFCIRDLEDALRPTAMYIILNYIWNKVRSKLKKRLLVIDEAWTMMQFDDSARFLFGLVKRARKYYLGITTITQDVEDFVKSTYGKPVITNSSMQLLLKQAPAAMEYLTKIFNLTEGEKYMLLNSGVGQGLFFAGLKHVALQIIASYTEDKIVTTNPEEILKGRETNIVYEGQ